MNGRPQDRGVSLTELLLVLAVLATVTAVAVPSFTDVRDRRLDAAASEVGAALRHARHEALRTGIPHGVRKVTGEQAISVFRIDTSASPRAEIHDVSHPIDRNGLYKVDLGGHRRTRATTITAWFSILDDAAAHEGIAFNARGEPIDGLTDKPLGAGHGYFLLANGNRNTRVTVAQVAGRVARAAFDFTVITPPIEPLPPLEPPIL